MKILKNGDSSLLNKRNEEQFKCDECGCEFTANEIEYGKIENQRDGATIYCKCPYCGNFVTKF